MSDQSSSSLEELEAMEGSNEEGEEKKKNDENKYLESLLFAVKFECQSDEEFWGIILRSISNMKRQTDREICNHNFTVNDILKWLLQMTGTIKKL